MKFLEEYEDETMHSGADVDAFTAALTRDIQGQFPSPWQPTSNNENTDQNQHELVGTQPEQHSSAVRIHNQQPMTSGMSNQPVFNSGLSNQQAMSVGVANQQANSSNRAKQVSFARLFPILTPLLDKDRGMELEDLYKKLKGNEIAKETFVRHMRAIVGDEMLKRGVYKLQQQDSKDAAMQRISNVQVKAESNDSTLDNNVLHPYEVIHQGDPQNMQSTQMSSSYGSASSQDKMGVSVSASRMDHNIPVCHGVQPFKSFKKKIRVSNCWRSARKKGVSRFLRSAKKKEVSNLLGAKEGVSTTPVSCSSEDPAEIGECKHKSRSSCLDNGLEGTSTLCKDCDAGKGKSKRSLQDQLENSRKLNKVLIDVLARKHSENNALKEKLSEAQVQIKEAESRGKLKYLASEEHKEDVKAHAERMTQSFIQELKDWLSSKDEKDLKRSKFDENTKSSKE